MTDFAGLAARLTHAAQRLAEARTANRSLATTAPALRWRRAALLWPQFTKG